MKKFITLTCILLFIYSCNKSTSLQYTPPEIVSGYTGIDLIENSGAGQTVYIIEAPLNVEVAGYFIGGEDADLLTLNSNTVSLNANPDFEVKSSYNFEVIVIDLEGNIIEIQGVSFSIIDVDETPQFVLNFCENGFAGEYPCNNYDLIAHIDLTSLGGDSGNDCWGWTDPTSGKEYALMGLNTGTSFIDISDLEFPRIVGFLPTHTINSSWRDIKTYGNYAFIVSEASGHGMQVFDLTKLRNISPNQAPETFTSYAHYDGFGDAHNIVINKAQ